MTTLRLPRSVLADLKARAAKEGKSLNRYFLQIAVDSLHRPTPKRGIPKDDPLWQIGRNPGHSGITDGSENHDFYLYGPVTYRPPQKP